MATQMCLSVFYPCRTQAYFEFKSPLLFKKKFVQEKILIFGPPHLQKIAGHPMGIAAVVI